LVPGLRAAGLPPVPVVTPDLPKLRFKEVDGVKEFRLHCMHTRREFLPGKRIDVWGYNGSMPGPTIEVTEGDRVRLVIHNMLPESTILHLHGLEVPNRIDGVHGVSQETIKPGACACTTSWQDLARLRRSLPAVTISWSMKAPCSSPAVPAAPMRSAT
jgi:FtsP/CotA-like multicopper oxidase with cupredoxin domain